MLLLLLSLIFNLSISDDILRQNFILSKYAKSNDQPHLGKKLNCIKFKVKNLSFFWLKGNLPLLPCLKNSSSFPVLKGTSHPLF
jgi:hypothetical protein